MKYIVDILVILALFVSCTNKPQPKEISEKDADCKVLREDNIPILGLNCIERPDLDLVMVTSWSTRKIFLAHKSRVIYLKDNLATEKLRTPYTPIKFK